MVGEDANPEFAAAVARIDEQSKVARANWFGLLAFLSFVGVSLLAVEDADFFIASRQVQLPLIGVAIPTDAFFWFAPLLAAALYVYLHIHLTKLWRHLVTARRQFGGQAVHDAVLPWLVNDLVLTARGEGAAERHPISTLSNITTFVLVWLAGPLVLAGFWWRSMPAHDEWMTLFIVLCLVIALNAGTRSWRRFHALIRSGKDAEPGIGRRIVGTSFPVALVLVSWLRTEGGFEHYRCDPWEVCPDPAAWTALRDRVQLATIDLVGVEFTPRPADWRTPEVAQRSFMIGWCAQRNLPLEVCNPIPADDIEGLRLTREARANWCQLRSIGPVECRARFVGVEDAFADDFWRERTAWRSALPSIDLQHADLRRADLERAFLPNSDLTHARLKHTSFTGAILEGANLKGLRPRYVNFVNARLEQVDLEGATFEGVPMRGVHMDRADLLDARFTEGFASNADFSGALLSGTRFRNINLDGARFDGSLLQGTLFSDAVLTLTSWTGADANKLQLEAVDLDNADMAGLTSPERLTARRVLANADARLPESITAVDCFATRPKAGSFNMVFVRMCGSDRTPRRVGQIPPNAQ
ncbi:MAG: pentapeptide repeat-containing protein [Pseudomonadota bacterium]